MTVINAMKFSDHEGGMVSDSQITRDSTRKYDIIEKVFSFDRDKQLFLLMGGTGKSETLRELKNQFMAYLKSEKGQGIRTVREAAQALSEMATTYKRETIEQLLKSKYGISFQDALSGEGIDTELYKGVKELLIGQDIFYKGTFGGTFLMIGKDEKTFLYQIEMGTPPAFCSTVYESVGSGKDEADKVLGTYVTRLPRSKKNNIPLVEGMAALIRATNAAEKLNKGVGGIPNISYFNREGITILDEKESLLALEIVRVHDAGLIKTGALKESLDTLLHKPDSFEEVDAEVFKKYGVDFDRIMFFLRGYKH